MAKVGRFIVDPRAGAYCQVTLDSGEKIVINHDKGGFKGGHLTIEIPKLLGLSSNRIFSCDLDSPEGHAALTRLTGAAEQGTVTATPLGAMVQYLRDSPSVADVQRRCAVLISPLSR